MKVIDRKYHVVWCVGLVPYRTDYEQFTDYKKARICYYRRRKQWTYVWVEKITTTSERTHESNR